MLENISIHKILFLDVETVPIAPSFSKLSDEFQLLWAEKTHWQRLESQTPDEFYALKAGLMAEFAKIICVSVGYIYDKNNTCFFRIKSFYGDDEKLLLNDFKKLSDDNFSTKSHYLCAHNGKEFDYPFLCRRMIVNGVGLPRILEIAGKKPWEVRHLDTMDLWRFGDYKHYTSIKLLAALFDIPTPKDDIDGSMVAKVYYEDQHLERIVSYCEKDVVATIQLFRRYEGKPLISEDFIQLT